jgi:hypothetical protein
MRKPLAVLLCMLVPLAAFGAENRNENSYKVSYDGGSVTDMRPGTGLKLHIGATVIRLSRDKLDVIMIPAAAITEISYGRTCIGAWALRSASRSSHSELAG